MKSVLVSRDRVGRRLATFIVCGCAALPASAQDIPDPFPMNQQEGWGKTHMAESVRATVGNVVVIAGLAPPAEDVTGTYDQQAPGFLGGWEEGRRKASISGEAVNIPVRIPIPVISDIAAIFGGISGARASRIQAFRDALTEELINAESDALGNDGLALDVFWAVRRQPTMGSSLYASTTPVPEDTDAILYVSFDQLKIDVQGDEAIVTTAATASLRRVGDLWNLYNAVIRYQDRARLEAWTENENALWRSYTNFARYYLGHAVAADVFGKVELEHKLLPVATDSVSAVRNNDRLFRTESMTPTLAWRHEVEPSADYGAWTEDIDESNTWYDIEIFDDRELVYDQREVPEPRHMLAWELEPCRTYRWSVRPVYQVDGGKRFGEWMRFPSDDTPEKKFEKGLVGRNASVAPAYTQDFAQLEIACP